MKKLTYLFILIAIGLVTNAHAIPIFGNGYSDGGNTYTVVNQSGGIDVSNGIGGYTAGDYTGTYIGTLAGGNNDNLLDTTWGSVLSDYLGTPYTISGIAKVDAPATSNGGLTVTYDSSNLIGTWSTVGANPADAVSFYSVKGAKEFALYYVNPARLDGIWTTRHLLTPNGKNQPGISHISADLTPTAPVPEPATMLLLGTGLVGLAGIGRKKFKK